MIERAVFIENELGLHARAAAKLVRLASQFEADIKLSRADSDQSIDAKSILGVLLLAAAKGTELRLTLEGVDEQEAADRLIELIRSKFGEQK
ncbi:MAG: HPr family phosphocarrier protein [Acidobacteriota bacterium]|nr:MAG: HPr family phosphocarrier protein [Acidobacteriota bacterium]